MNPVEFTRCYSKIPDIGMLRETRLYYICKQLVIASCIIYEPICQAAFCCDNVCVFCMKFCDVILVLFCDRIDMLN
jgi:hypothetical protein